MLQNILFLKVFIIQLFANLLLANIEKMYICGLKNELFMCILKDWPNLFLNGRQAFLSLNLDHVSKIMTFSNKNILFNFPIWRMMSNNADLVSLNQTIRHWKNMLNEKNISYVSFPVKCMYVNVQKKVLKFEFIAFLLIFWWEVQYFLVIKAVLAFAKMN